MSVIRPTEQDVRKLIKMRDPTTGIGNRLQITLGDASATCGVRDTHQDCPMALHRPGERKSSAPHCFAERW